MPLCASHPVTSKTFAKTSSSPPSPMDLDFSLEEIRMQLAQLGVKNLTPSQLFEIKRDLDDMIRREQSASDRPNSPTAEINKSSNSTTAAAPVSSTATSHPDMNMSDLKLNERRNQKKVKWKSLYLDPSSDSQGDYSVSIKPNTLNHLQSTPTPQLVQEKQPVQPNSQKTTYENVKYSTFASLLDQQHESDCPVGPKLPINSATLSKQTAGLEPNTFSSFLNTCRSNQILPPVLGSSVSTSGGGSSGMFSASSTWKPTLYNPDVDKPHRMSSSRCTISHSRADSSLDTSLAGHARNHWSAPVKSTRNSKPILHINDIPPLNSNESLGDKFFEFSTSPYPKLDRDESVSFGEWPSVLEDFITHQSPGMNRDTENANFNPPSSTRKPRRRRRSASIRSVKIQSELGRSRHRHISLPSCIVKYKTPSRSNSRSSTPSTALNSCRISNSVDGESETSVIVGTTSGKSMKHPRSTRLSKNPVLKVNRISTRPQSANSAGSYHSRRMSSSISTYGHNYWYKKRQDPVSKYQAYQRDWLMYSIPGENSRKLLRWNIRTAMMHREVPLLQRNCAQLAQIIGPSAYQLMDRERKRRIKSLQLDYVPPTSRRYNDLRSSIKSTLTARI